MAKKDQELATVDAERRTELAGRAFALRLDGHDHYDIADRLGIKPLEAEALVTVAYSRLSAQTADDLRVEVEGRLDAVLRKLSVDLALADSQTARNGVYKLILATEAQRARLLGLNLPAGGPDE